MTLNELPINSTSRIKKLNCDGNIRRRLLDLGIISNTPIKAVLRSPSGDPTAYEIRGALIAIRKEDTNLIEIQ